MEMDFINDILKFYFGYVGGGGGGGKMTYNKEIYSNLGSRLVGFELSFHVIQSRSIRESRLGREDEIFQMID